MKYFFVVLITVFSHVTPVLGADYVIDEPALSLYLARLGIAPEELSGARDEALLNKLMQHHLVAIPFENLDMHCTPKRVIDIAHDAVMSKVLMNNFGNNRGGYCYEINELFYGLLKTLGFDVSRHKAAVWVGKDPGTLPVPSHEFSIVRIENQLFLADVSFSLYTIFGAVRLPTDAHTEVRAKDSQGKTFQLKRVTFDDDFHQEQQGLEGFIYERWSDSKQCFERISSFALTTYQPQDYLAHNNYVQHEYRPFLENVFYVRFDWRGRMIRCVRARSEFGASDEIVDWIKEAQVAFASTFGEDL